MKKNRLALVIAIALSCASCSGSLFESDMPAPIRYVLAPPAAAAAATESPASRVDLSIGRPDVAPGLDTDRVAVIRGHELDYYRGTMWGGTVIETVQALLVATLQDQKLFRSVTAEQARISGDYLLDAEVRDFQAEYTEGRANPEVRVTIVGRLIRIGDRKLIETLSATASRPATENRMTAVAVAFEAAAQQVALELARGAAGIVAKDADATAAAARN